MPDLSGDQLKDTLVFAKVNCQPRGDGRLCYSRCPKQAGLLKKSVLPKSGSKIGHQKMYPKSEKIVYNAS